MRPSWVTDCVSRVVRSPMKASSRSLASPKSSTLSRPSGVSITFSGFRSRCRIPWRCAAATASVSPIASDRKRSVAKPRAGIALLSVSPSTYSIVRKRIPSASSIECSITMPGWLSEATARASRSKRWSFSLCEAVSGGSTLSATRRPSRGSSAR